VLWDQSRRVIGRGPRNGDSCRVQEAVFGTDQALATIHRMPRTGATILPFCVEFRTYGIGIEIFKKDLSLKNVLPILLLNGRGAKTDR
jgi:hypothetical protein